MAHPGFGHLWQQAEMSDLDIVISCDYAAAVGEDASGEPEDVLAYRQLLPQSQQDTLLQQFPGHSTILSLSPFFKAQASVRCLAALQLTFEHNRGLCWCCPC